MTKVKRVGFVFVLCKTHQKKVFGDVLVRKQAFLDNINMYFNRGFIKGRAPGKLTGCEHNFARLLYISKNFFLIQGMIKNSFKLQSCPFLDEFYRV